MPIKEIEKIFRNLSIPYEFGGNPDIDDYDWLYEWCDEVVKKQIGLPHTYSHGVSKLVFILDNCDWVVKIPFNGYYEKVWNKEKDEYDEEQTNWVPFKYADGSWDYCNLELEKYEKLQELDLECFLAEIRYLCSDCDNHPMYIQEKIIPCCNDKKKRTPSEKSLTKAKNLFYHFDKIWIATAIDFYGEKKTLEFLDYIENIDQDMGEDLHSGNYGYREDGSPCLLDYSGWND